MYANACMHISYQSNPMIILAKHSTLDTGVIKVLSSAFCCILIAVLSQPACDMS